MAWGREPPKTPFVFARSHLRSDVEINRRTLQFSLIDSGSLLSNWEQLTERRASRQLDFRSAEVSNRDFSRVLSVLIQLLKIHNAENERELWKGRKNRVSKSAEE